MTRPRKDLNSIRIGGGSAFFNDRLDAALELVERGNIDVLVLETLAERTLAMLHVSGQSGGAGYWDALGNRLAELLPILHDRATCLVTNAGGADPAGCATMVYEISRKLGLDFKIAVVHGDEVSDAVLQLDPELQETGEPLSRLKDSFVCANAYMGADAIADAYAAGADIIVTGRVTDSALTLGPAMAALGWARDDYDTIAAGLIAGHILECGGQATGGYFAEPGIKDVPDLDRIGFPIAEIHANGEITLSKPQGSGGRLDRHTVTEQLLYEVHDPRAYLTPDGIVNLSRLILEQRGDTVVLSGATGRKPTETLKIIIGVKSGFLAEAEISYSGFGAVERVSLAAEIVRRRASRSPQLANREIHIDYIGINSVWPGSQDHGVNEVRMRVASRLDDRADAERLITEVESLYVNGPAGGGGVRHSIRPTLRTYTAYIDRKLVTPAWHFHGAAS